MPVKPPDAPQRLIVAMTGASGQILGVRLLQLLQARPDIETHLILSRAARITLAQETDFTPAQVEAMAREVYRPGDIAAAIASGSFPVMGMVVVPCSIKTLSAIAHSYASDLITRAADVQLKEGRPLLLAVRETPLHLGHLRLMTQAAELGAILFPPVPAFYARPASLDEMVTHLAGRILARIGIANDAYPTWSGPGASSLG